MGFSLLALGSFIWILIAIAVVLFIIFFWGIILTVGILILKVIWLIISIPMQFLGKKSKQGLNKVDAKLKSTNKRFK